jgi:hypothetical protein
MFNSSKLLLNVLLISAAETGKPDGKFPKAFNWWYVGVLVVAAILLLVIVMAFKKPSKEVTEIIANPKTIIQNNFTLDVPKSGEASTVYIWRPNSSIPSTANVPEIINQAAVIYPKKIAPLEQLNAEEILKLYKNDMTPEERLEQFKNFNVLTKKEVLVKLIKLSKQDLNCESYVKEDQLFTHYVEIVFPKDIIDYLSKPIDDAEISDALNTYFEFLTNYKLI